MDILDKIDMLIEDVDGLTRDKEEEAKLKIMAFLKDNPAPPDSEIHKMSDDLGIDIPIFEGIVYKVLGSFAGHGRAKEKGFEEKDADPHELAMGIRIESEHTNWPPMAKRIALDHLAECKTYYTRLVKMEKECAISQGSKEED